MRKKILTLTSSILGKLPVFNLEKTSTSFTLISNDPTEKNKRLVSLYLNKATIMFIILNY